MMSIVFKGVVRSLFTIISLILCFISTTATEPSAAVSPVIDCELDNETYICTGAQYRMYCNTTMHHFYYQRYQNQYQYQCISNGCICVSNRDTCACYYNTTSCFCEIFSNNITVPTAVRPLLDCEFNNDAYICTGAQYHMYCNTAGHYFSYYKYQFQNQYQYRCWSSSCDCRFSKDSCWCYSYTSSCFCTNYGYSIALSSSRNPVTIPACEIYNDMYICTGSQYRMYCNTRMHTFYNQRYQDQNQYEYQCLNNCDCRGNKDTCTCYSSTLSSCFCEAYSIPLTTAVGPVTDPDCVLNNDTYICTGAQYRMYCNTSMHDFNYQKYQYKYQYQCVNNNCNCIGNKDTCTCSSSTFSSCFCETYGSSIALFRQVSTAYDCVLNNNTYICTGAQYRIYCNTSMHSFSYQTYLYQCWNNNCNCIGNTDTCTCYSSTFSSCFCEPYSNNIALTGKASTAYGCVVYNDTYICTGAQYLMYCNTKMHDFYYWRYQNQNQDQYRCVNNNCNCVGNKDTCTCSSSTLSSCFCTNYNNTITIPAAVSPVTDPGCELHNDTYICTGAQYRMYCNSRMHDFYYRRYRYQNQDQYQCVNNNCNCVGNKDTCTCFSSTLPSCYCEIYGSIVALFTVVMPAYDCVLYNDTYVCTGAQYRMYCNTTMHYFTYWRYQNQNQHPYQCSNNCDCRANIDTCTCSSSSLSSCFCTNYNTTIAIPAAVSPITDPDCVLYNDTYTCTGAQYRMYCSTTMHDFNYRRYQNQDQYQCVNNNCNCVGNKDTCTCSSSTFSSCFCEYNISTSITISPTTSVPNITLPDQCRSQASEGCLQNILDQIENITAQILPVTTVMSILTVAFNSSEKIVESSLSSPTELASFGNRMLKSSEKLISTLVKPTDTSDNVSFTLPTVEGQVFMVGPQVTLDKIPRLDTTHSSVDIDLIGISKNNIKGSAAVAFMSYNTMENLLKPDFFNTSNDTIKTMMSTVISATLPRTTNTTLTKPVNFTFRHIREFNPSGSLSCVYWKISEWIVDGCSVLKTNSSFTVCSCVHLSTFALIMQTSRPPEVQNISSEH